jgi:hypothetical protein
LEEDTRKKIRETLSGLPERGDLLPFLELVKDHKLVSDVREFGVGFMVGYAYASGIGMVLAERVYFGDLRRISEEEKSIVISMVMEEFVKFRERVERELGR